LKCVNTQIGEFEKTVETVEPFQCLPVNPKLKLGENEKFSFTQSLPRGGTDLNTLGAKTKQAP